MLRDMVKNITGKQDEAVRYGLVNRRISSTRVEVKDDAGRTFFADHNTGENYQIGQRVVVVNGRITGTSRTVSNIKTYEV